MMKRNATSVIAFLFLFILSVTCFAQTTSQLVISAANECEIGNVKAKAPLDGYGYYAIGGYCDGLVVEQHSAPSLQIVSFSAATEALSAAKILFLRTPFVGEKSPQILKGRNFDGAAAYRFDARVKVAKSFELNLDRIATKHKIDATSIAFVGEALIESVPHLTPVVISKTSGQTNWPAKYLLQMRLSSAASAINYVLILSSGGGIVDEGLIEGPIGEDELVRIPIKASKPGIYSLNIVVKGVTENGSSKSTAFSRRIYTGVEK